MCLIMAHYTTRISVPTEMGDTRTHCKMLQQCDTLLRTVTQMLSELEKSFDATAHCNTLQHTATHCNTL